MDVKLLKFIVKFQMSANEQLVWNKMGEGTKLEKRFC